MTPKPQTAADRANRGNMAAGDPLKSLDSWARLFGSVREAIAYCLSWEGEDPQRLQSYMHSL